MKSEWEYRVETLGSLFRGPKREELEELLNQAALEGWELLTVAPMTNSARLLAVMRRSAKAHPRERSAAWP